jgi:hypothetical protein
MTDWHPDADQLVELALSEADAADQERILAHLTTCQACRDEYAELSDGVQQALAATPSVAPPAGFSGRVLDAMAAESTPVVRPAPRARLLLVAAGVVVGLLAGVGGTLAATTWVNRPPAASSTAPVATRLLTATGDDVGSAGIAMLSGRSYLVLNVTSGRPGVRYDCILVGRDGSRTNGGSWVLADEYGTGAASGSWLVPLSGDAPASVELVAPSGTVWSRGTF